MPGSGSAGAIPADAASLAALLSSFGGAGTPSARTSAVAGVGSLASSLAGATPYGAAADLAGKALSASGDSGPTSATSGSDQTIKTQNTGKFGDFIINKGSGSVSAAPAWALYAALGVGALAIGYVLYKKG